MSGKRRALFLDRDGVFNELVNRGQTFPTAPWNWREVRFYNGLEILHVLRERQYLLFLITNQPDIERRTVDQKFVQELNDYYVRKYLMTKAYTCPFADAQHPDKKPNPGMLLRAAGEFGLDLAPSWFLGDTKADVGAANNAGCKSILIDRPYNQGLEVNLRIFAFHELASYL